MAGATPETVIGDRGYSVEPVFEHVTRAGAAPVLPWRANKTRTRHDEDEWDRHGVMRCKFCGGPTHQIKFSTAKNEPRLWFRCINPAGPDCGKEQTISCSKDWRALIPLARTEELYHELKASHKQYEAAHDRWRDRYKVAADNLGVRPKALGLDWHRLRANVACLVEWMRIAAINDWLGSTRPARRKGVRRQLKAGADAAKSLKKMRATMGLLGRYGAERRPAASARKRRRRAVRAAPRRRQRRSRQHRLALPAVRGVRPWAAFVFSATLSARRTGASAGIHNQPRSRGFAGKIGVMVAKRKLKQKVLMIDNYDSFTYNLVQYLEILGGHTEVVGTTRRPWTSCFLVVTMLA